jgi:phospholipid/cholesterol/gamma-HCH transport system ATP-binding protein
MLNKSVIEINNLKTQFGQTVIHQALNLKIPGGEIVALIGDSGSGKSTLLREIIRLEKPVSGSIYVFGQDVLKLHHAQLFWLHRRCGMMFQQGALFSSLTVAENVAVPLSEHTQLSPNFIQEIAILKMAMVGLPASARNKYPAQLSGGMIKRAAIARALALEPDILFLDEPTAGLDPISAEAFDELILQLKEMLGLTVVIVTHDVDLLWKVADKIAVLADKSILTIVPIDELIQLDCAWLQKYFKGPRGRVAHNR